MGKAYRVPTSIDRLRRQQKQIKELQGIHRSRNTPKPVAATAFAGVSAAGDIGGTGNFLRSDGGPMNGPLALSPPIDFRIQMDADGGIDIGETSSNSQYTSNIQLDDVQPNTFTLDTIAGAAFDGQLLFVRTFAPSTPFTIAQATFPNGGNIQTPNDTDVTIGDLQMILFMFDASLIIFDNAPGGTWRLLNTFGTGSGGFSDPLTQLLVTLSTAILPATVTIDTDTATEFQITLDQNIEFNIIGGPASGRDEVLTIFISQDGTGGHTIDFGANVTNPPVIGTDPNESTTVVLVSRNQGTTWSVESATSGSGGSTLPVFDSTPIVKGSVDPSKLMRFEIDGFTTATTRTMTMPNANVIIAGLGVLSQTWTGENIFAGLT